jgi:hypothetical protein
MDMFDNIVHKTHQSYYFFSIWVHEILQREAAMRRQNKGPAFKFLVPLVYAPVLPLSKSPISFEFNIFIGFFFF